MKETAKNLYLSGLSTRKIAKKLDFSCSFVAKILDAAGVERRSMKEWAENPMYLEEIGKGVKAAHDRGTSYTEETRHKLSEISKALWQDPNYRNNHPAWKGGISYEPYGLDFNADLKQYIRTRDNYVCAICSKSNRKQVHHIDYNKQNSSPTNLITLCVSCHCKTNFNRPHWQSVLTPIARGAEVHYHSI